MERRYIQTYRPGVEMTSCAASNGVLPQLYPTSGIKVSKNKANALVCGK